MMKFFYLLLSLSVCAVLFLFVLVRWLESKSLFYPDKALHLDPSSFHLTWQDVWITTSDGVRINAWLVKNDTAKTIILFSHGNGGNVSDRLTKLKFFHDLGFEVLIYDYRGFGKSEGKPSERGIYLDAQAAYDWIKEQPALKAKNVLAYGASLGGAVAIDLAQHRPVSALVVDSSITRASDMAHRLYPMLPSIFMSVKLDSLSKIKNLTMPKIFIHSVDDNVVPFDMGETLFKAAAEPKTMIKVHGGHNDVQLATNPKTVEAFKTFLNTYGIK